MEIVADQLLGCRQLGAISTQATRFLRGKRALVTGAAGSIGSEIVRQLWLLTGELPYLVDIDESRMHALQLSITGNGLLSDDRIVLADIRDKSRMERIFRDIRPDVVFHAAANKHLTLLERYPCEGVKSNVLGTDIVTTAAASAGVERFINVSTDKAADPSSILGATKRIGELITQQASDRMSTSSVRFGNVLGSRGSFLEILRWQMEQRMPVTVTHPDVTRYFMTIPQAARLVLEVSSVPAAGEVFVLDMGSPVRIVDLVNRYAALIGQPPPEMVITGLRPGEKLHEVLFSDFEDEQPSWHESIRVASPEPLDIDLRFAMRPLFKAASSENDALARSMLFRILTCTARRPLALATA